MATLCKTFPTTESALHAAEALSAAGVPAGEIGVVIDPEHAHRLITGAQVPDDVARRMVRHLHEGEAIMFVQLAHLDLGVAQALIGQSAVMA